MHSWRLLAIAREIAEEEPPTADLAMTDKDAAKGEMVNLVASLRKEKEQNMLEV
ncbi:hypothetical protein TSUD_333580 [Trifolium subterraneum]|uniref:Uncharacterized protein n=1 Tax=Trifolium subterraneum TaxID=3900 RepID=A0A2Z6NB72_TRISU|nr:hypothetical protein TSUD_333580 [Trifolium subterraneum]